MLRREYKPLASFREDWERRLYIRIVWLYSTTSTAGKPNVREPSVSQNVQIDRA